MKSVLIEVGQILGAFKGKLAVIGGAAPSLREGGMVPGIGFEGGMEMPREAALGDSRTLKIPLLVPR